MIIQSTIPILFPLKERELPVQAIVTDGDINEVKVTVEGAPLSFTKDRDGNFISNGQNIIEPAYAAYIGRQLCRRFN